VLVDFLLSKYFPFALKAITCRRAEKKAAGEGVIAVKTIFAFYPLDTIGFSWRQSYARSLDRIVQL